MTARCLATYYRLHVWWARRPLVASRAAILASLLPADADREKFMHVLGIHGDPVAAKKRIAIATRKGEHDWERPPTDICAHLATLRTIRTGSGWPRTQ